MIDIVHNMNFPGLENEEKNSYIYQVKEKENGEIEFNFIPPVDECVAELFETVFHFYPELFNNEDKKKQFQNNLKMGIVVEFLKIKIRGKEDV